MTRISLAIVFAGMPFKSSRLWQGSKWLARRHQTRQSSAGALDRLEAEEPRLQHAAYRTLPEYAIHLVGD